MPRKKAEVRARRLNSDSLRARTLDDNPSLDLITKRTDMLIKFFADVHPSRIFLNDWIRMKSTEESMQVRSKRVCKIGDSVNDCGSLACVGGFTVILFAPAALRIDGNGELRTNKNTKIGWSVASIAQRLLGVGTLTTMTSQISGLSDTFGANLKASYYEDTAEDWLNELFDGVSQGVDQREEALERLREFRKNVETLKADAKRMVGEVEHSIADIRKTLTAA